LEKILLEGMEEGRDSGIVAERADLEIDEKEFLAYAEFCLIDKH
jgi:hypothetical protein